MQLHYQFVKINEQLNHHMKTPCDNGAILWLTQCPVVENLLCKQGISETFTTAKSFASGLTRDQGSGA